jgi:hypothetical protein
MRMRILAPLLALAALSACDGGGTGSETAGGEYIAALESPHGAEGAALLELSGEGIQDVYAASLSLFDQPVSGGRRVMLIREPAGRLEFRVRMAAGNGPPTVRVLEVVDGADQPRASTDGYEVTFTRTRGAE